MDAALLFPSKYLKSADFKGKDVTLTIASIKLEDLADDKGGTKTKGIVAFKETPKLWVLNRTNVECVKGMFGRETDAWLNKRVTLYPAPFHDPFTNERTTAIRLRGSPDIEKQMTVEVRLPRKKPVKATMIKTGQAGAPAPAVDLEGPPMPTEPM